MTKSNSSVQLSLVRLRKDPRFTHVEKVEQFIPFPAPGHRLDLFGIIDVLAIGPGITLAVQCTTKSGTSGHKRKLFDAEATAAVLRAGWEMELHAWEKPKHRWECKVYRIQLPPEPVPAFPVITPLPRISDPTRLLGIELEQNLLYAQEAIHGKAQSGPDTLPLRGT